MARGAERTRTTIDRIAVSAYTVPTDFPESDSTLAWDSTTIVIVQARAADVTGLGYTYADTATARLIDERLARLVVGRDPMAVPAIWADLKREVRNLGLPGICAMAIAAVDNALWDLKARLLGVPLITLLGAVRDGVPVYGSGGFTSYPVARLQEQLAHWVDAGIRRVKMKVGTRPAEDPRRVHAAREAIGPDAELFVDANGAYSRKTALAMAERFRESGVSWFEEPVPFDDLEGLRLLRDRAPAGMDIAAGEYGYELVDFRRTLEAGAVDVLQADATRCAGITGFLRVAALCEAHGIPLSAHTAPSLHAHPCCAVSAVRHLEYFHDHVRIERAFFDGALEPHNGVLRPDPTRLGIGVELRRSDAARYLVYGTR